MKREGEAVRELIMSLENELLARKQVIEAANDTIVVKVWLFLEVISMRCNT